MSRQAGLTLIELLVAMLISLIVVATVIEVFVSFNQKIHQQDKQKAILDRINFTTQLLRTDISLAGFDGCTRRLLIPDPVDVSKGGVRVKHLSSQFDQIRAVAGERVSVSGPVRFNKNNRIMIANCDHAYVYSVQSVSRRGDLQRLRLNQEIHAQFQAGDSVGKYVDNTYFVSHNKLMLRQANGRVESLVGGVDKLSVVSESRNGIAIEVLFKGLQLPWRVDIANQELV